MVSLSHNSKTQTIDIYPYEIYVVLDKEGVRAKNTRPGGQLLQCFHDEKWEDTPLLNPGEVLTIPHNARFRIVDHDHQD
jgi:hypothetical protein